MAQLNMMSGGGHPWNMQQHAWNGSSTLGGSNMSLNMPQHGYDQSMWNPWMQQFPQMMPPMMNGELKGKVGDMILIEFASGMSRSRNHSRAASPALSIRSRRSMMSSRSRQKYQPQDLTDDEDSDIEEQFTDDSRSRSRRPASVHGGEIKNRTRRMRQNSESLELDQRDTEVIGRIQRMKEKSKFIRERRSGSLTNWPTSRDRDSGSLSPSDDEIRRIATKYRKSSLTSPTPPQIQTQKSRAAAVVTSSKKKIHSDSASEDISVHKSIKNSSVEKRESPTERDVIKVTPGKSQLNVNESEEAEKSPNSENRPLKVIKSSTSAVSEELSASSQNQQPVNEKITAVKDENILVDWECEHCTFVNEATATVCTICCKTRVEVLKTLPNTVDEEEIDIKQINESILRNENDDVVGGSGGDLKQKGKVRKISFLPGTKAH